MRPKRSIRKPEEESIEMKIDSRNHQFNNAGENRDRLLLIVPPYPVKLGIIAAPEELEGFAEGDVVSFREPYQRGEGGGKGNMVFVTPGNCEKITDPEVADACRSFIWGI
jgi:hypothetical protein